MKRKPLPGQLILASGSRYRKRLLQRLAVPFECYSPDIIETAADNESPAALVNRLACSKAQAIAQYNPAAIVIGSDQLAVCGDSIIGKPDNRDAAIEQLLTFSGRKLEFLTSVCVQQQDSSFNEQYTDITQVYFRTLSIPEIERYLDLEQPYDCAGAFKAESLGIVLFERIITDDPTAIVGLPLIRTAAMLRRAGLRLP